MTDAAARPGAPSPLEDRPDDASPWAVLLIFLRLGLTSFGGPVAHLAYFRDEFVVRRRWIDEHAYADLVALCQFLPGPASSQVGLALGLARAGPAGAIAAWLGFTMPSALILIALSIGVTRYAQVMPIGLLAGLKIVAVAVVAQAVWAMARQLCPDAMRRTLMVVASAFVLCLPSIWTQALVLGVAALIGLRFVEAGPRSDPATSAAPMRRGLGLVWLTAFFVLLAGLPLLAQMSADATVAKIDAFYRAGALVFGGGHVVLPLLQTEVVATGWVDPNTFLAGYGAAQAMPGPLFAFSAFLGAAMTQPPTGLIGGLIALVAIFVPGALLVLGALPFWEQLRRRPRAQAALAGVNAAVVGLLLAALYQPVWTSAIHSPRDVALMLVALAALTVWKWPPWLVVVGGGLLSAGLVALIGA